MSDAALFGDIEPADAWCAEGEPAPEQVAYRLHELRRVIDQLAGQDPGAFDELKPAAQELALAIGQVVVDWLRSTDPDLAADTARQLHAVRRYWSGNTLPAWEALPEDHREVAVGLISDLLDWLAREGSLQ